MSENEFKEPNLDSWFSYHPPIGDQATRYERIREAAKYFAAAIVDLSMSSRERTHALNHIREAVMWANAGIACNEGKSAEEMRNR